MDVLKFIKYLLQHLNNSKYQKKNGEKEKMNDQDFEELLKKIFATQNELRRPAPISPSRKMQVDRLEIIISLIKAHARTVFNKNNLNDFEVMYVLDGVIDAFINIAFNVSSYHNINLAGMDDRAEILEHDKTTGLESSPRKVKRITPHLTLVKK